MRKKIVRLTESQLYDLVEQTLNELNWKTYMNSANKRMRQGFGHPGGWDTDKLYKGWALAKQAGKSL